MASDLFALQDRMSLLSRRLDGCSSGLLRRLSEALDTSWIYHDGALEGERFDLDEILAALRCDDPVPGSSVLVAGRIQAFQAGIALARRELRAPSGVLPLDFLKRLHAVIRPDECDRPGRYRQLASFHRSYFQEIAKPSRISYLLRRLFAWLESEEARRLHPVAVAGELHYRLLQIYPFEVDSGRAARLFVSYWLMGQGYLPAVLHAQDRQRYFKALAEPDSQGVVALVAEALENGIRSSLRLLDQLEARGARSAGLVA